MIMTSCSVGQDKKFNILNNDIINTDVLSSIPTEKVSYNKKVRPILDNRCVVCHGCYDAPCQLKLSSMEGIKRGATKEVVYDGARITAVPPTRLEVDHKSTKQWRDNKFFPIVNEGPVERVEDNLENSLLYKFLQLKQIYPQPRSGLISYEIDTSISREQYCTEREDFDDFASKHKALGMPFAMPNLTHDEFFTLGHWIAQGSHGDDSKDEDQSTLSQIRKFEKFLNNKDLKHRLVARYIYEHLFLGHIHFKNDKFKNFYRLVRSNTAKGEIEENTAIRPYDDPKQEIYYRFKIYTPSIVAKSHNVYELSDRKLERFKDLFIRQKYAVTKFPSYQAELASNPFKTFIEIPIKSKYQFLLDDARFFIEGFIKGPVCRGQIALNVIEDRFWVFFTDPNNTGFSSSDKLLTHLDKYLDLPAAKESSFEFISLWSKYWSQQKAYLTERNKHFVKLPKTSLDGAMNYIWDGDTHNPNAALTIFRHLDSASVRQGLIGTKPDTTWVLNYPIFERIHYLLVAGFNVYGNVSHQLKTRIYMDFLRMEGEEIFLSFLPPMQRKEMHTKWFGGNRNHLKFFSNEDLTWLNKEFVQGYKKEDKERELLENLSKRVARAIRSTHNKIPKELAKIELMQGEFFKFFPETIFLKVDNNVFTLVHNKTYRHVDSFLSDAKDRELEDIKNDTLTVVSGIEGTYPNLFIDVPSEKLSKFIFDMAKIVSEKDYNEFISKYGIRRTQSNFWKYSDWFFNKYKSIEPKRAGILDLNRYN